MSVNFHNFAQLYLRLLKMYSFQTGKFTNKGLFPVVSADFPDWSMSKVNKNRGRFYLGWGMPSI